MAATSHVHSRSTYPSSYGPEGLHPSPPSVMSALEKGATFAQAYAPPGTGFRHPRPPQAQPQGFQPPTPHTRRPPPSIASDSPARDEPAARADRGKKSGGKQQQSQLQLPVKKSGLRRGAKSHASGLSDRFNAGNEQVRQGRLSNEFVEVPPPVTVPDRQGQTPAEEGEETNARVTNARVTRAAINPEPRPKYGR